MAEAPEAGVGEGDRIDVAGAAVSAGMAETTAPRPRVVIVAEAWGSNWGERAAATRLVAGALAASGQKILPTAELPPWTARTPPGCATPA